MDYSKAGVDRKERKKSKKHFSLFRETFSLSRHGKIIETPFNTLYPVGNGIYHVKTTDGVGTKVLLAQLAGKNDTIGIDAVASVANDCIRSGAEPVAMTNTIDIKKSDESLVKEIQKGLNIGAKEALCPMVGGELADIGEILSAEYHINCDCAGEVKKENIIRGNIKDGQVIIGVRSSGLHTNGFTLARKILFKEWGGKFDAFQKVDGLDKELAFEALEPTKIYVKKILNAMKKFEIQAAVHITGDAYLKFGRLLRPPLGIEFNNFKPQEIFNLVKREGKVSIKEMLSTFNMGWGFALVAEKNDSDDIISIVKDSEVIGKVNTSSKITVVYGKEKIFLA
jgi:phosphoribosylformylglycinamidine cyclo-ligase